MTTTALEKQIQQTESELKEKLNKLPDILKDDGYPDVQAFMKTYRKAEAIITQYNQDLAEWEQTETELVEGAGFKVFLISCCGQAFL